MELLHEMRWREHAKATDDSSMHVANNTILADVVELQLYNSKSTITAEAFTEPHCPP
jgi:hypothetical protein